MNRSNVIHSVMQAMPYLHQALIKADVGADDLARNGQQSRLHCCQVLLLLRLRNRLSYSP